LVLFNTKISEIGFPLASSSFQPVSRSPTLLMVARLPFSSVMMTQSPIDDSVTWARSLSGFQRKYLEKQQPQQTKETTPNRRPSGSNQNWSDRTDDFVFPHNPSGVHHFIRRGDERIAHGFPDLNDDIALLVQDSTDFVFLMGLLRGENPAETYFVIFPQVRSSIDEIGYIPGLDLRLDPKLLLLGTKRKIKIDNRGKNCNENGDDDAGRADAASYFLANRTSFVILE
jgi:hypothetical protein